MLYSLGRSLSYFFPWIRYNFFLPLLSWLLVCHSVHKSSYHICWSKKRRRSRNRKFQVPLVLGWAVNYIILTIWPADLLWGKGSLYQQIPAKLNVPFKLLALFHLTVKNAFLEPPHIKQVSTTIELTITTWHGAFDSSVFTVLNLWLMQLHRQQPSPDQSENDIESSVILHIGTLNWNMIIGRYMWQSQRLNQASELPNAVASKGLF